MGTTLDVPDEVDDRHERDHFNSSAWSRVDSEIADPRNAHHRFWWSKHTGHVLAVLLEKAGYSQELQYRDLKFFATVIVPHLGASLEPSVENHSQWHSFMTDDGTPVELSWDWGTSDGPPMIRYSIEPVGLHAGQYRHQMPLQPVQTWRLVTARLVSEVVSEPY